MIGWLRKIFILLIRKGEKMKEINKKYVKYFSALDVFLLGLLLSVFFFLPINLAANIFSRGIIK